LIIFIRQKEKPLVLQRLLVEQVNLEELRIHFYIVNPDSFEFILLKQCFLIIPGSIKIIFIALLFNCPAVAGFLCISENLQKQRLKIGIYQNVWIILNEFILRKWQACHFRHAEP
jgi:hypothetical protein